jgi:hypothetical protein
VPIFREVILAGMPSRASSLAQRFRVVAYGADAAEMDPGDRIPCPSFKEAEDGSDLIITVFHCGSPICPRRIYKSQFWCGLTQRSPFKLQRSAFTGAARTLPKGKLCSFAKCFGGITMFISGEGAANAPAARHVALLDRYFALGENSPGSHSHRVML